MTDVEAQGNGHPGAEEAKALTDEKVPEVKIAPVAEKKKTDDDEFRGLTKEELLRYATDPFWIRLRWVLFIGFWVIWLAMLVASVVIIVYAPKCPSPEPKVWWQKGPIYKLNLATFKDSDGNGIGDIKGLTSELDYMVETGINTLLIAELFNGDEDGDYKTFNAELGTKADWDQLVEQLNNRNIKVIIDLPAAAGQQEMDDIVQFWMDNGVDGFNIDSFTSTGPNGEDRLASIKQLRTTVDAHSDADGDSRILVSLGDRPLSEASALYGSDVSETHVGSLFHLVGYKPMMSAIPSLTSTAVVDYVKSLSANVPTNAWPTFSVSGSSSRLAASAPDMVDGMNMLSLLLPATPVFNYGDELGLRDGDMNWDMQANQTAAAAEGRLTHYTVFSALKDMRHQQAIHFGDMIVEEQSGCLVLLRVKKGNPGYILVINFNEAVTTLDLSQTSNIAENLKILVGSVNGKEFSLPDPNTPKSYPSANLMMEPRQAVIYTFVPVF